MTPFVKMQGCGNDFVIFDGRKNDLTAFLDNSQAISMVCDRRFGVGCDQLIVMQATDMADIEMLIRNADGSVAGMCGNAARCVADIILQETGKTSITILVGPRLLHCTRDGDDVCVDMGAPASSTQIDVGQGLPIGTTVDMGNPHIVFFVEDVLDVDLPTIGPKVENHPAFPNKTNVEFVSKLPDAALRMRVWERGAGITLACGSGACAVAYAAQIQGHSGSTTRIVMDGGVLSMCIRAHDGHVLMTGPARVVYSGLIKI